MSGSRFYAAGSLLLTCLCALLAADSFVSSKKNSLEYFGAYSFYTRGAEFSGETSQKIFALANDLSGIHGLEVIKEDLQLRVRIPARDMFRESRAQIQPGAENTLSFIGSMIKLHKARHVHVEGHTSDEPSFTPQYPGNWYLSAARAINAAMFLQDAMELPSQAVTAEGKGSAYPVYAKNAENNRIELVITP